jgi:hypothetical protein
MNHRPYLYGMEIKNKYNKPFVFGAKSAPKKSKWSNSSFWLDFDSDYEEKTSRVDVVKLAGYKRAISNFVNIVTGKSDIHVKYNDNDMSYTDGKTVTISSKLSDGVSFDTTVGLALHEGSHCLLTNFSALKNFVNNTYDYQRLSIVKDLTNVIEDRRIDSYIYKNAPGYRGYYDAMYDEYFNAKSITNAIKLGLKNKPTLENYMFHIINIANPNRNENALPGLKDIFDMIDLKNIDRIKSTSESIEIASQVYEKLLTLVDMKQDQDQDQDDQNNNQSQPGNGSGNGKSSKMKSQEMNDEEMDGDGEDENDEESDEDLTPRQRRAKEKAEKEAQKQLEKDIKDIQKNLDKDIKKQKEFLEGKIKKGKVSKTQSKQIDTMTSNDVYIERVGEVKTEDGNITRGANVNVLVINDITPQIIDSGLVSQHYGAGGWRGPDNIKAVQEGMQLGILLGKKLKTRDEERVLKTTRCANGNIDKRLIAELGFGAENVFSQIIHYNVKPVYVHLSIDASGSMAGTKWTKSLKTAVAIAKACSMVSNIHVCIDIRGEVNGMYGTPLTWVVYDSKKNNMNHILKHFPLLQATSSTPESLCYESIRKQIVRNANGKESFFITFSDGEPSYYANAGSGSYHYSGQSAYMHCKNQVNALKKNNIHVLAYYITEAEYGGYGNDYYNRVFKSMYGENSAYIDTTALNALSRSINGMFERKQIA